MSGRRHIVVTGLGAIAPNGLGEDAFWDGLIRGRSGINRITRFDASTFPCQIAGEVNDFQPTSYIGPSEVKRMSRVSQFAVAAAKMALEGSGLRVTPENARKVGVCFGTSAGKGEIFEADHLPFLEKGVRGIHPLSVVEFTPHGTSSHVAIELGSSGFCGSAAIFNPLRRSSCQPALPDLKETVKFRGAVAPQARQLLEVLRTRAPPIIVPKPHVGRSRRGYQLDPP